MKSRKIRLIALLFALLMFSTAFSENENCMPVYLYYDYRPPIDGIRRPHRAPDNTLLSLEAFYDVSTSQLVFTDFKEHNYYYMVVDENENVLLEGYLDFENNENICVSITTLVYGTYTLVINHEGNDFQGSFEIE